MPNESETSDMSDSDVDSKVHIVIVFLRPKHCQVLEMTKRFGGARKSVNQKIQKIRFYLPLSLFNQFTLLCFPGRICPWANRRPGPALSLWWKTVLR